MKQKWKQKNESKKYRWQTIEVPRGQIYERERLYYDTSIVPCNHHCIHTTRTQTRQCSPQRSRSPIRKHKSCTQIQFKSPRKSFHNYPTKPKYNICSHTCDPNESIFSTTSTTVPAIQTLLQENKMLHTHIEETSELINNIVAHVENYQNEKKELLNKLKQFEIQCTSNDLRIKQIEHDKQNILKLNKESTDTLQYKLQQNNFFLQQYETQNKELKLSLKNFQYEMEQKNNQPIQTTDTSSLSSLLSRQLTALSHQQLLYTTLKDKYVSLQKQKLELQNVVEDMKQQLNEVKQVKKKKNVILYFLMF
jgi:hypothetical protein